MLILVMPTTCLLLAVIQIIIPVISGSSTNHILHDNPTTNLSDIRCKKCIG